MKILTTAVVLGFLICFQSEGAAAQVDTIQLSRNADVKIVSQSGNSSGSGFFIGDQTVATCFHVVARLAVQGQQVRWAVYPDLQVVLPSGETINATVASIPSQTDESPLEHDFALIKLAAKPTKSFSKLTVAQETEHQEVGDEVVFSGHPLATPGMVTHRGMVSGFNDDNSLIFIEAPINKGNSGGAVLNTQGHVIGILSMREGGISKGLADLNVYIGQSSSHGSVQIMGVDTRQATKALIQTLDEYSSTGLGYAQPVKYMQDYIARNPETVK
jgi:S1-C subfamily serine protease